MHPLEDVKNVPILVKLASLLQFAYLVGRGYIYMTKLAHPNVLKDNMEIKRHVFLAMLYVKHALEEKKTIVCLAFKLKTLDYKITHASVKLDLNCKIISVLKGTPLHLI